MNDPDIHSSVWDWDTASTAQAWKHSHDYIHHTYTNIRGKDKDLGYEIMRIDPAQKWHPGAGAVPCSICCSRSSLNGVWRCMTIDSGRAGRRKVVGRGAQRLKGISGKARAQVIKDYLGWPMISAGAFALAQLALRGRIDQPAQSRVGRRLRKMSSKGRIGTAANLETGSTGRRKYLLAHLGRRCAGQRHPQRVGARHHLLRALPRPDLHI